MIRQFRNDLLTLATRWQNQGAPRRTALAAIVLAVFVVVLLVLAQAILNLNPYQVSSAQVNAILIAQPDLESRLDYVTLASERLKRDLNAGFAREFIVWYDRFSETELDGLTAAYAGRQPQIRASLRAIDNLAHEVLMLETMLARAQANPDLPAYIASLRHQPGDAVTTTLNKIYTSGPLATVEINMLRSQILTVDHYARLVIEDPAGQELLQYLQPSTDSDEVRSYLISGLTIWKRLPLRCQSIEIQFANTVAILAEIQHSIDPAWRVDRLWGFSLWEPAAVWVNRNTPILSVLVVLLIGAALFTLLWRPVRWPFRPFFRSLYLRARNWIAQQELNQILSRSAKNRVYAQDSHLLVHRLTSQSQAARLTRSQKPKTARLMVLSPDGHRVEKNLPPAGIFRIGSDPAYPVQTSRSYPDYMELWVRKARRGYFLEVMFSEIPVLLNRKPVSSAHSLKHGDMIQVHDMLLVYLDH